MKKLMIAACAIALAAVAQAASVNWTANMASVEGKTTYVAALIDASAYESLAAAVADIIANGSNADGAMLVASALYVEAQSKIIVNQTNKQLPASYDANQTVNIWSIMFDGTVGEGATAANYYNMTATALDKEASVSKTISAAGALNAQLGAVSTGEWQSVPEPTSGLLMLLGMGALALRRRRA